MPNPETWLSRLQEWQNKHADQTWMGYYHSSFQDALESFITTELERTKQELKAEVLAVIDSQLEEYKIPSNHHWQYIEKFVTDLKQKLGL